MWCLLEFSGKAIRGYAFVEVCGASKAVGSMHAFV